jgi:DNA-directed RNA polymerase specialized sigma24 family protein
LVALDDALTALESVDARKSQVVELRYFAGLSIEEAAEVLKVSPVTVIARLEPGQGVALSRPQPEGRR